MASRSASTRLTDSWTRRGLLACALWPVSIVYRFLVALRRKAYQTGVFQSHRVSVPVLVVGNVVAGGAGKTPVVMLLVAHLQARGLRVGVVSRGYGRTLSDCREVLPGSLAQDVGDEPKLIQQTTGAPVFVARKRHDAANALLAAYPRTHLILCDDGLQHLALGRDLEICVFDERGARNGFLLPAGPLREPWPREVDFTLHSSSAQTVLSSPATTTGTFNLQRQLANYALRSDGQRISLENLEKTSGRPLAALAAIAHPERFFAMLRARGLKLQHTIPLPDHYDFNSWSSKLYETYTLVCTEKDAVKLWPQHPDVLAVPLVLCPEPGFLTALDSALDRLLAAALPGAS